MEFTARMLAALLAVTVVFGIWVVDANSVKDEYWEIKNVRTNKCLDVTFERQRYRLYVHPCKDRENQRWSILGSGPLKTIAHNHSKGCLESGTTTSGIRNCKNATATQQWKIEGDHFIAENGKCMDIDYKMGYMIVTNCSETKEEDYRKWEHRKLP